MINELSALRLIEEQFPSASNCVEAGIGDDAAALKVSPGKLLLATTDCQVEDVHFLKAGISPDELARKSVAVSVSDIGAMGGVPKFILASLGFSKNEGEGFLRELIKGFKTAEQEFGVKLVGGNLSSSEKLFLDVTTLGEVEPEYIVRRSGALPGDAIYVSGTLGDSALGLKLLMDGRNSDVYSYLTGRHKHPTPRLALGRRLALSGAVTSMIDVSDGLLLDLERITVEQGAGARLHLSRIPVSREYSERISDYTSDFYDTALSGGEDYELLFTSHAARRQEVQEISGALDIQITEIGEVTAEPVLTVLGPDGNEISIKRKGFIHFGN
ncbi:MAG: thiamine-phosphate kinase [Thermodesulfobacteriota bacterium]